MSFNDVDKLSKPYENSVNGITGSHSSAENLVNGDLNANGLFSNLNSNSDTHATTQVILGRTSASGQSYASYAKGRYEDLTAGFNNQFLYNGKTTCEFVTDSSLCPDSCPENMVCDGKSCVYPKDCPCFSNSIKRQVSFTK